MPLFFQNLRQSKYVRELYNTITTAETLRFIETYFRVENELGTRILIRKVRGTESRIN